MYTYLSYRLPSHAEHSTGFCKHNTQAHSLKQVRDSLIAHVLLWTGETISNTYDWRTILSNCSYCRRAISRMTAICCVFRRHSVPTARREGFVRHPSGVVHPQKQWRNRPSAKASFIWSRSGRDEHSRNELISRWHHRLSTRRHRVTLTMTPIITIHKSRPLLGIEEDESQLWRRWWRRDMFVSPILNF